MVKIGYEKPVIALILVFLVVLSVSFIFSSNLKTIIAPIFGWEEEKRVITLGEIASRALYIKMDTDDGSDDNHELFEFHLTNDPDYVSGRKNCESWATVAKDDCALLLHEEDDGSNEDTCIVVIAGIGSQITQNLLLDNGLKSKTFYDEDDETENGGRHILSIPWDIEPEYDRDPEKNGLYIYKEDCIEKGKCDPFLIQYNVKDDGGTQTQNIWSYRPKIDLICAEGGFWKACGEKSELDAIVIGDVFTVCLNQEDKYSWVECSEENCDQDSCCSNYGITCLEDACVEKIDNTFKEGEEKDPKILNWPYSITLNSIREPSCEVTMTNKEDGTTKTSFANEKDSDGILFFKHEGVKIKIFNIEFNDMTEELTAELSFEKGEWCNGGFYLDKGVCCEGGWFEGGECCEFNAQDLCEEGLICDYEGQCT